MPPRAPGPAPSRCCVPGSVESRAASARDLTRWTARIADCRACPRLVAWREEVAATRRAAFRDQEYWGRPVPGFGPADAPIGILGLAPAAHGGNRTGRVFTGDRSGDVLYAALHRAGLANQPTSVAARRRAGAAAHPDLRGRALRAAGEQAHAGRARHLRAVAAPGAGAARRPRCASWSRWARSPGRRGGRPCPIVYRQRPPVPRPAFGHGASAAAGPGVPVLLGSYHVSQQNTFTGRLTPGDAGRHTGPGQADRRARLTAGDRVDEWTRRPAPDRTVLAVGASARRGRGRCQPGHPADHLGTGAFRRRRRGAPGRSRSLADPRSRTGPGQVQHGSTCRPGWPTCCPGCAC